MPKHERANQRSMVMAGLAIWAIAGVPLVSPWLKGVGPLPATLLPYLVFPVAFLWVTSNRVKGPAVTVSLLAVQSVAAVMLAVLKPGLPAALLAVVAGQLPFALAGRTAVLWLAAQTAVYWGGLLLGVGGEGGVLTGLSFGAFELFAFGAGLLAQRESQARQALTQVHAELLATQALLEHSTRQLERERVSRELHDALGHHLTALSLQLEVARNLVQGDAAVPVLRAVELSKSALHEVRQVVSTLREEQPLDLAAALQQLASGVPGLAIHLKTTGLAALETPRIAHAVLRGVQEAVTNAARHARAQNLWIEVSAEGGHVSLVARDDGQGSRGAELGNGLKGLTERLAALGGRLEVSSPSGQGFTLHARIPLEVAK